MKRKTHGQNAGHKRMSMKTIFAKTNGTGKSALRATGEPPASLIPGGSTRAMRQTIPYGKDPRNTNHGNHARTGTFLIIAKTNGTGKCAPRATGDTPARMSGTVPAGSTWTNSQTNNTG